MLSEEIRFFLEEQVRLVFIQEEAHCQESFLDGMDIGYHQGYEDAIDEVGPREYRKGFAQGFMQGCVEVAIRELRKQGYNDQEIIDAMGIGLGCSRESAEVLLEKTANVNN